MRKSTDVILCFPELITARFVCDTLLPLTQNRAVNRILFRVGQRSEYAREILIGEFLKGEAEYAFIVDADMSYPANTLERLLSHKKKIISGLYFSRGDITKAYPVIFKNEPLNKWPKTRYFDYQDNALIEIGACGHGCLLIHRDVLEEMEPPYSQLGPFHDRPLVGSDLRLCLRARELGYKIYCDTGVKLGHLTIKPITEEDWLNHKENSVAEWYKHIDKGER